MANDLDQVVINLVDAEIDKLCDEGVPDISATHVADRVGRKLREIDRLIREGLLDISANPIASALGGSNSFLWYSVRELGEVKGTPGMVHLRDVAAKRMARRFDPKGSAHMKFYYEFDKLPIARRASRG